MHKINREKLREALDQDLEYRAADYGHDLCINRREHSAAFRLIEQAAENWLEITDPEARIPRPFEDYHLHPCEAKNHMPGQECQYYEGKTHCWTKDCPNYNLNT